MAQQILRYPEKVKTTSDPYVIFTSHRAHYDNSNRKINMASEDHIALYMPAAIAVSDSMGYENAATGIAGALYEAGSQGGGRAIVDQAKMADAKALIQKYGAEAAAGIAAVTANIAGAGMIATIVSSGTLLNVAKSGLNEWQKTSQSSINPREFSLFKAPTIRQFGYNFTFIPESANESRDVVAIIKSFRRTMYPEMSGLIAYKFPHVYSIEYIGGNDMIKIPEVALTGANIVYNPNSKSYFKGENNSPTEIQLSLTFQELKPITSDLVEAGY